MISFSPSAWGLILFALGLISLLISQPYKTFKVSLVLLPITFLVSDKSDFSVHLIWLTFCVLRVLINRDFGPLIKKTYFFIWSLISATLTMSGIFGNIGYQIWFVLTWILSAGVVWLILSPPSPNLQLNPLAFLSQSSFVLSVLSLLQLVLFPDGLGGFVKSPMNLVYGDQRFAGLLGDYELISEWLTLGLISTIAAILLNRLSSSFFYPLVQIVVITVTLFLSGTRSGLVIFPAIIFLSIVIKSKNSLKTTSLLIPFGLIISLYSIFNQRLDRKLQIYSDNSFSSLINRAKVWSNYESLRDEYRFIGKGPRFPWEDFGLYPHSLVKTLLFTGGVFALILFVLLAVYLTNSFLVKIIKLKLSEFWVNLVLLFVFMITESKVEFTRLPNYILIVGVFLATLNFSPIRENRR